MAEVKGKTPGVSNITRLIEELGRMGIENYMKGLEFLMSIWEDNLNLFNKQVDLLISVQEDYTQVIKDLYNRLTPQHLSGQDPKGITTQIEHMFVIRRDYINEMRNTFNRVFKNVIGLNQKDLEKFIFLFEKYLNLLR